MSKRSADESPSRSSLLAGEGRMSAPPPIRRPKGVDFPPASAALRATVVSDVRLRDVRFHTSLDLSGSDARSKDPDYSIVYAEVTFSRSAGPKWPAWEGVGVGISFTLGRGTELILASAKLLARGLRGLSLGDAADNFAVVWRRIVGADDGQLLWMGPEKGCVHQASSCLVNAVWDGWAKHEKVSIRTLWACSLAP